MTMSLIQTAWIIGVAHIHSLGTETIYFSLEWGTDRAEHDPALAGKDLA